MRATVFATLFAIASTLAALGAVADGVKLKGDELVNAISGKKYTGTTRRGGTWEATYAVDGTMEVRVLNSDWSDSGTWEIKDDKLCSERSRRSYMCYSIMRVSDDEYHWVDERRETQKSSGPQ